MSYILSPEFQVTKKKASMENLALEVTISAEVMELAARYVKEEIIPQKYEEDALHIVMASILDCNAVVSLNFSHMVKLKTIMGVNGINATLGYRPIEIVTPLSVTNKEHDEE
ncbi:MAG: hypothetical protein HQK51_09365 [Oligoflexia bacterium]|nr:hypothetical protein [Oligoflexia bacterium]